MPCNSAATIRWIQATERLVGLNASGLADTLNRPLRDLLTALGLNPDAPLNGCTFGGAVSPITKRLFEMRTAAAGIANGDPATVSSVIVGIDRYQSAIAGNPTIMQGTSGSQVPGLLNGQGRRGIQWFNVAGTNVCFVFRPAGYATTNPFSIPFYGPTYPTATVALNALGSTFEEPQYDFSFSISAWCRKLNGGDGSDCRMFFGFANNTTVTPSKPTPRVGLLGDGIGGYRYGSVNCPDGAAGGSNVATDIDANSVQPADIVAPGTNWWHTRIKLIPAQPPAIAGVIACYHNFNLVAQFNTSVNLPRGHQGTNDSYDRIEACVLNFSGDAGGVHVPELVTTPPIFIMEDDLTI